MSKAHEVIEERLCDLVRAADEEEREKTSVRVAVTIHTEKQAKLDALCRKLGMSRSQLGGQLLEAAIEDAEHYYQRTTSPQGDLLEGTN